MNSKLVEYRQAFSFFDANRDGHITAEELEQAMNKCGIHPTKLELRVIMSEGDKDKNGVITFDEFVQMIHSQQSYRDVSSPGSNTTPSDPTTAPGTPTSAGGKGSHPGPHDEEGLWKMFKMFDKNGDGFIDRTEMNKLVKELLLGKDYPTKAVDQMFREADVDGDGRISFSEFMAAVL